MDLIYLIRSGLGIPDYWHPHLELQTEFLSGKIARYPISMDTKAGYPGQLDEEGIPIVFLGRGRTAAASPMTIVLYGLGSHDAFIRTRDPRYHRQLMCVSHWLEHHGVPLGVGIGWPNDEDFPVYRLKAPWFSGAVQGLALSLFIRVHQLDGAGHWAKLAYHTWEGYHVSVEEGGFYRKIREGIIYEEYPGPELDCAFSGMCIALIGLWEGWRSGVVGKAKVDFDAGVRGLRALLPRFVHGRWSLYSLNPCLGKAHLASPYYQRSNGLMAQLVSLIAEDPEFRVYGDRWLKSSTSMVRRVGMSLRIGLDRYLHARNILGYDGSKSV